MIEIKSFATKFHSIKYYKINFQNLSCNATIKCLNWSLKDPYGLFAFDSQSQIYRYDYTQSRNLPDISTRQ